MRSLSGQGRIGEDRLCGGWVGAAVRRVIGSGLGERMAVGGRAMGSCESELVAAFLSLAAAASQDIPSWIPPDRSRAAPAVGGTLNRFYDSLADDGAFPSG